MLPPAYYMSETHLLWINLNPHYTPPTHTHLQPLRQSKTWISAKFQNVMSLSQFHFHTQSWSEKIFFHCVEASMHPNIVQCSLNDILQLLWMYSMKQDVSLCRMVLWCGSTPWAQTQPCSRNCSWSWRGSVCTPVGSLSLTSRRISTSSVSGWKCWNQAVGTACHKRHTHITLWVCWQNR